MSAYLGHVWQQWTECCVKCGVNQWEPAAKEPCWPLTSSRGVLMTHTHTWNTPELVRAGGLDVEQEWAEYLTEQDGAFIVRACNAHDELVAALERLVRAHAVDGVYYSGDHPIAIARAALAKVKPQKVAA